MRKKVVGLAAMTSLVMMLLFVIITNATDEIVSPLKIEQPAQLQSIKPKLYMKEDQARPMHSIQASQENDTGNMTMAEIDNEIFKIDQKIMSGKFIENSNAEMLTNYQLNYFRNLLKKRDELFVMKVDLLLSI